MSFISRRIWPYEKDSFVYFFSWRKAVDAFISGWYQKLLTLQDMCCVQPQVSEADGMCSTVYV
jgi:hypothetical protein